MRHLTALITTVLLVGLWLPAQAVAADADWVISAKAAKAAIAAGPVTVLDARGEDAWAAGHVPGAVAVRWETFSETRAPHKGKLLSDEAKLTRLLQARGVMKTRPVIVYGDPPNDWGEDGRIVWMLRTLGHPKAAMVDGGITALKAAGVGLTKARTKPARGDFVARRTGRWSVGRDAVKAAYERDDTVVVDTREPQEFAGATPYGESRGGHIPGAAHLYYKALLRDDGRLKPRAEIGALLARHGIASDRRVVTYCTGGIRSAWLAVVLADMGYDAVANYAGSMWEWSAAPSEDFPLTTTK